MSSLPIQLRRAALLLSALILGSGLSSCASIRESADRLLAKRKGKAAPAPVPAEARAPRPEGFDALMDKLATEKFGQTREAEAAAATAVRDVINSGSAENRRGVNQALVSLFTRDSSKEAKLFAARQLALVGEAPEAAALSPYLTDPELSDFARYALERIPAEASEKGLLTALGKTNGQTRIGIVNSLGARGTEAAVPPLEKLCGDSDLETAQAAAVALGKIERPQALEAIKRRLASSNPKLRPALTEAALRQAERYRRDNSPVEAEAVYQHLYAAQESPQVHLAGLRGLLSIQGARGISLALESLSSSDPHVQAEGARFIRTAKAENLSTTVSAKLPSLTPAARALAIEALGERGHAEARPAAVAGLTDADPAVRRASLGALATLGDASSVPLLLKAGAQDAGEGAAIATKSLAKMKGEGIDAAILASAKSETGPARVLALNAAAARRSPGVKPALLDAARTGDEGARQAALKNLAPLATREDLAPLSAFLKEDLPPSVRPSAESTTLAALASIEGEDARADAFLEAFGAGAASDAATGSALRVLGGVGGKRSLKVLSASLKAKSPEKRNAAIGAIAGWENGDPKASGKRLHAPIKDAEALKLLEPLFADPQTAGRAGLAAAEIAGTLQGSNSAAAKSSMKKLLASAAAKDPDASARAKKVLDTIAQFEDFITTWEVAGPFRERDKSGAELLDKEFPPESGKKEVEWKAMGQGLDAGRPWLMDLGRAIGGDNRAAYLRTQIYSPKDTDALLELGSDDGIKVWLNGAVVHSNNANRSIAPAEDKVKVKLKKGWNPLVLKVVNGGSEWGACARIRGGNGSAIDGLRADVKGGR